MDSTPRIRWRSCYRKNMHYPLGLHTTAINYHMSTVDITSVLAPSGLLNEVIGAYSLLGVNVKNRNSHEGSLWSGLILTFTSLSYLNRLKSGYSAVLWPLHIRHFGLKSWNKDWKLGSRTLFLPMPTVALGQFKDLACIKSFGIWSWKILQNNE